MIFEPTIRSRLAVFVAGLFAGVFVAGIVWAVHVWLLPALPVWAVPLVAIAIIAFMTYQAYFTGRIRLEVSGTSFRLFDHAELKYQIEDLSEYDGTYSQHTSSGEVMSQVLHLTDRASSQSRDINCVDLNVTQFARLWAALKTGGLHEVPS